MRWLALVAMLCVLRQAQDHRVAPAKIIPAHVIGPWRADVTITAGLTHIVLEPRDVRHGTALPTILYFHGRGGRARIPDPEIYAMHARIIIVRAPEPRGEGFAWLPVSAHHGESDVLIEALEARERELGPAIDALRARYPMTGPPIAVGFSQGGMIAIGLALHHPERVSGAIAMASWYPPSRAERSRVPIVMLHGRDDHVLDAERSRSVAASIGARFELFDGAHEARPEMARRVRSILLSSM
jgi:predicted esterase